jgi:hypothetical protein
MDLPTGYLQRSEQAGGAVAHVIMGHADGQLGPHRQRRLGAVKRLNLRLFIHARHQLALRRVQIEPDDIGQLGVELRVATELEAFGSVRLEPILLPDARTVAGDSPTCLAKRRALQWVAALGLRSVALITACSLAEVIRRGRAIRGLVRSPSSPALR